MGRYKPRPLAILTIPAEHSPVPGGETVRLRFFGAVQQDRAETAERLEGRRRIAESHKVGFDADLEVKVMRARTVAASDAPADEQPDPPTPLEEALANWPAVHVIRTCLHSIVDVGEDVLDDPVDTPETPEAEREQWLRDQSAGALDWLAEQQLRAAGLLRDTEAARGEG